MSDIIEEKLRESYNIGFNVEKTLQGYDISVILDWQKGFKFTYNWKENKTIDNNIEEIEMIIDELIVKFYKKESSKHGNKSM